MATITITKEFTFEAAHFLPKHEGKCKNLHGHTYRLQVGVSGFINPKTGMIIDFGNLNELVQRLIIKELDHTNLNTLTSLPYFPCHNPTAELVILWIVNRLTSALAKEVTESDTPLLRLVKLWETPTNYVEWQRVEVSI